MRFTRKILFFLCLLAASKSFAQYSDEQLYAAYLERDMTVWEKYISQSDWYQLSNPEKLRLLHYEFGFTAYAINTKHPSARAFLDSYEHHLIEMKPALSEGQFLLYDGAAHSYELSYDHGQIFKQGPAIYSSVDRALTLEPDNPVIITLRGQLDLFNPMGNKKKAMTYFLKADSIYHIPHRPYYTWNIRACQMAMLMCMQKMGQKNQAILKAHDILENEEPKFKWISSDFLPSLE